MIIFFSTERGSWSDLEKCGLKACVGVIALFGSWTVMFLQEWQPAPESKHADEAGPSYKLRHLQPLVVANC